MSCARNPIGFCRTMSPGGLTTVLQNRRRMPKQHIATMKKQNIDSFRKVTGAATLAVLAGLAPVNAQDAKPEDKDAPKPEARVAVVGDADFGTNSVLGIQGNKDMFMNIVGWLSQQENLISVRPKEPSDRRITLTATQQNWIVATAMLLVGARDLAALRRVPKLLGPELEAWVTRSG